MRKEDFNGGVDVGSMRVAGSKNLYESSAGQRERKEKISEGRERLEDILGQFNPNTDPWYDFARSLNPFFEAVGTVIKTEGAQVGPESWVFSPTREDEKLSPIVSGKLDGSSVDIRVRYPLSKGWIEYATSRNEKGIVTAESTIMECDPEPDVLGSSTEFDTQDDRAGILSTIRGMNLLDALPPLRQLLR